MDAFARTGRPSVPGQSPWPSHGASRQLMALQERSASAAVPAALFATEHKCAFWDALPGALG